MRNILAVAAFLAWLSPAWATPCYDGSTSHARRHSGSCAPHRGIVGENRGYRYWDGPESDYGTRWYGENGGTVHYGY